MSEVKMIKKILEGCGFEKIEAIYDYHRFIYIFEDGIIYANGNQLDALYSIGKIIPDDYLPFFNHYGSLIDTLEKVYLIKFYK